MIIQIWMEGYRATEEHGIAQMIGSYEADDFDEAVKKYMEENPGDVRINGRNRYPSDTAYENRPSKYNIWACNLFDNEADARKAFG
ncbi:hypothetical protein LCGC14_0246230 [marine sediment metagenome]|uniref:Uncharacterized protein n=1 Tax=marine sediment metagenome TaxID=412755 RepID=A0A0F9UMJ9_9ZZZZ